MVIMVERRTFLLRVMVKPHTKNKKKERNLQHCGRDEGSWGWYRKMHREKGK